MKIKYNIALTNPLKSIFFLKNGSNWNQSRGSLTFLLVALAPQATHEGRKVSVY